MNYKDFKDYPQLIQILKNRNLVIEDENKAIEFLKINHYYRLSAYFIPFQYSKNSDQKDDFKGNVSFEDTTALYLFDKELRNLVFSYLSELEIILRAQISHIHSKKYGPFGYIENAFSLKRELRINGNFLFYDFISQVNKEKDRASEDFIRHIKEKYKIDDLPLWALVEILSFGALSKFIKLMQKDEQLELMNFLNIASLKINVFENWIETLSYIRNLCAHHSRLWNRKLVKKFKSDKNHTFLNKEVENNRIFFAISIIAILLKDFPIKQEFENLLKKYPNIDKKSMGIPQNWTNLFPWSAK